MRDKESGTKFRPVVPDQPITIKATWYDHFAKHWYEYPRRFKADSAAIPSLCLRGQWLADAGFPIGQKVDVEVSAKGILLKMRPSE